MGGMCTGRCCTAPLARSSKPIFFKDQFLLNACLPHGKSGGITRPCTGARVPDILRQPALLSPDFMQYTGGKGADDEGTVRRAMSWEACLRRAKGMMPSALPACCRRRSGGAAGEKSEGVFNGLMPMNTPCFCLEFD
jgi:hypothetical protein